MKRSLACSLVVLYFYWSKLHLCLFDVIYLVDTCKGTIVINFNIVFFYYSNTNNFYFIFRYIFGRLVRLFLPAKKDFNRCQALHSDQPMMIIYQRPTLAFQDCIFHFIHLKLFYAVNCC